MTVRLLMTLTTSQKLNKTKEKEEESSMGLPTVLLSAKNSLVQKGDADSDLNYSLADRSQERLHSSARTSRLKTKQKTPTILSPMKLTFCFTSGIVP